MDKETILYVYDYDSYTHKNNNIEEYNNFYIGKRVKDFCQLLNIIKTKEDCHLSETDYHYVMNYFWDNNSHDVDIIEIIKERIDKEYESINS